jgi:hypothetical protein
VTRFLMLTSEALSRAVGPQVHPTLKFVSPSSSLEHLDGPTSRHPRLRGLRSAGTKVVAWRER